MKQTHFTRAAGFAASGGGVGRGGTAGAVIVGAVASDGAAACEIAFEPPDPPGAPTSAGGGGTDGVGTVGAVPSAAAPVAAGVVPGGGGFVVPDLRPEPAGWPALRGGSWTPVGGALRARRGGSGGSRRPHD